MADEMLKNAQPQELESQIGEEDGLKEQLLRMCRQNKLAAFSAVLILVVILIAIFAPVLAPYGEAEQDLISRLQGPSAAHWFGTDELGRSRAVGANGGSSLHGEDVHAAGYQLVYLFHGDGDVHGGAGVIFFDDADDGQVHHLFDLGDVTDGVGADAHGSAHGGGFRHQGHDAALFGVKRLRLKCLTGDDEAAFDLLKQFFFLHIHQSSILILMTTLRT